jgi:hypothetical protein
MKKIIEVQKKLYLGIKGLKLQKDYGVIPRRNSIVITDSVSLDADHHYDIHIPNDDFELDNDDKSQYHVIYNSEDLGEMSYNDLLNLIKDDKEVDDVVR